MKNLLRTLRDGPVIRGEVNLARRRSWVAGMYVAFGFAFVGGVLDNNLWIGVPATLVLGGLTFAVMFSQRTTDFLYPPPTVESEPKIISKVYPPMYGRFGLVWKGLGAAVIDGQPVSFYARAFTRQRLLNKLRDKIYGIKGEE